MCTKPTQEQTGENYFVISLYKSEKICIIIYSLPFLKRQTSWRRSEAAVTRRTRNAFIGSSRYEGSNPSVSALEPLVFKGSFVFMAQGKLADSSSDINWCEIPVCVFEMGFLSNPDEDTWLQDDGYQGKIASGIAGAVDAYFAEGN